MQQGYAVDPGFMEVPNLANVGYPIAEIEESGAALISKTPNSGGVVSSATCKEQLLYELHDPARYLTPDVTTNFIGVRLRQVEQDVVQVTGGSRSARPDTLKVTVSYRAGWIGEGQVSYGVPGASERARLAGQIVLDHLEPLGVRPIETRTEVVGVDSTFVPRDLIRPSVTVHEIRA